MTNAMAISIAMASAGSCLVTLSATPFVRAWALAHGAVDVPEARRAHRRVTPRLGGIAIVLGFFAPLALLAAAPAELAGALPVGPDQVLGLALGGGVLALVGAIDDVRAIGPFRKLLAQAAAASIAFLFGYRIDAISLPFFAELATSWLAYPLTVAWFLAITNALNLIDGLDGLAAGTALIACVGVLLIADRNGAHGALLCAGCLAGALAGFLRHNFAPATIFMGDSGSLFVGFALAASSLAGATAPGSAAVAIAAPLIALGIPLADTSFAIVRRSWARRSIFAADRAHVHHRLLEAGLRERTAVLILYAGSFVLGLCALTVAFGRSWQIATALGFAGGYLTLLLAASSLAASSRRRASRFKARVPGAARARCAAPAGR